MDHLTPQDFKLDHVSELISKKNDQFMAFLDSLPNTTFSSERSLNEQAEDQTVEKVILDLQLSKAQAQQLYDLVAQYHTMTKLLFSDFIRTYHYRLSEHKSVNTNSFERLKAKLTIEMGKQLGS